MSVETKEQQLIDIHAKQHDGEPGEHYWILGYSESTQLNWFLIEYYNFSLEV